MSAPQPRNVTQQRPRPDLHVLASSPVDNLIARLDRVRKSGRGWTARCPAHEDRTASLSISVSDDGRVLLHCFAGCRAADVVAAAGLSLADLFVKRPTADMSFAERAAMKEYARQAQWRAALNVLGLETNIVAIAAQDLLAKRPLSAEDCQRLQVAASRISDARSVLRAEH